MNRIYRLAWSHARSCLVPVAEKMPSRGKISDGKSTRTTYGGKRGIAALVAGTSLLLTTVAAHAGPTGGQVTLGAGSISQSGSTTTITQSSQNLSLNWTSFNIAPKETVNFLQPSMSAIAVNRILGSNGTQILGYLHANGQVFLINPNGIVFGPTAEVNVGGLVASTLELSQADLAGNATSFSGSGTGSVVNQGTINANQGGYAALIGNHVSNEGVISAQLGSVALAAGSAVSLIFNGNTLVRVQVDRSVLTSLAENGGLIRADGGQVFMTAGARDSLMASAVNNTGVIEARTVESHDGTITLLGGTTAGTVNVGGTLDTSAPNSGDGGLIETSAAHVKVADGARVTTAAPGGLDGNWLIDPQDFSVAASGGDITGAALSANLATTDVVLQSSGGATAGGGNVNVNDAISWSANTILTMTASNNVNVNAKVTATGNTAGVIINPDTANGPEMASSTGTFNLRNGASINLPGTTPSLFIAGTAYTVINNLGAPGSTTGTDLQGMNGGLSGSYALGSNIDASATSAWNAGAGFAPIGNSGQFTGIFDGLGHTISNLFINTPGTSNIGLFGVTSGANLQNVGLINASVTGRTYVGALVGNKGGGNVVNAYSTGTVSGFSWVGGLEGLSNGGNLTNASSSAVVIGTSTLVGGLVGQARFYGTITNSYASGAVNGSGATYVGGLVGQARFVNLTNDYALGAVTGNFGVGGLVGFLDSTTIATSYSAGVVTGSSSAGGLVGVSGGTVTNSYWDVTRSGQATSAGGAGLTDAQMQTASNFAGFAFTTTPSASGDSWVIVDADGTLNNAAAAAGATLPMLASEYSTAISNAHELQLMAMAPAASYALSTNVSAAATALIGGISTDVWGSSGFVPIGSLTNGFTGTFDGLNETVSGLTMNLTTPNVGLFGYTGMGAAIRNVGLIGGSVTGGAGTGGLVGNNGPGNSVTNSHTTGSISGAAGTGGLVGSNTTGAITNSYATGSISGAAGTGGLVGSNTTGAVTSSYATGSVSGAAGTGGLIGSSTSGAISKSYATGSVNGAAGTGGLIGSNTSGAISNTYATGGVNGGTGAGVGGLIGSNTSGTVANSYAAGSVSGTGASLGALLGSSDAGVVTDSYWDKTTSIVQSSAGGGIGMSTAEMMTQANFISATAANSPDDPAWNFANTWVMYEGLTYPLLSGFMTPLTVTASNASKTYGQANPAFGVSYSTAATGNLLGTVSYSGSAQTAMNVGSYAIAPGGLYSNQQGYVITYANGALSVTPASLTVSANAASRLYGAVEPAFSGSVTGFVAGDTQGTATTGSEVFATNALLNSNVGHYSITGSGLTANNGNYVFVQGAGNDSALNITPAMLTYTAASASFAAGQTPAGLSGTLSGFVQADTEVDATTGTLAWTTAAGSSSQAGVYAIDGGGLAAKNYVFAQATGNYDALILTQTLTPSTSVELVQNVVAELDSILPSPQMNIRLAMLNLPPSAVMTSSEDACITSDVDACIATDRRTTADLMIPALRIVNGGVRLPDNRVYMGN
jgi:trimeric autotransporter adhesin